MSASQCLAGVFWAACTVQAYDDYGWPGVIFVALAGLVGAYSIIRLTMKGSARHDARTARN